MFKPLLKLNPSEVKRVQNVYPTLKVIQNATDVPWQMLAAVWVRESFSISPPKTPGGPWQFDPPPSGNRIRYYLEEFTTLNQDQKLNVMKFGINNFFAGGVLAACHLQAKVDGRLTIDSVDDLIKYAFWAYNGKAYGAADKSPYVMNGFDAKHKDMRIIGTVPDGRGGRIKINNIDERPGAFVVYTQLKELFP